MKNVTITFDPNAEAGQAAMADNRPLVKKLAIYAENVKEIDLHNVKIEATRRTPALCKCRPF